MEFYRLRLSKSKLKAVTRTSALFSGFAMVAMVELGLDYSQVIRSYRNSNIILSVPTQVPNEDGTELDDRFLSLNRRILDNNRRSIPGPETRSLFGIDNKIMFPYMQYHRYIELSWISSTVVGIFLFLVEVGLICFIKFYPISHLAAFTGALVMTPILIIFVLFTYKFYKGLAGFMTDLTKKLLVQMEHGLPTSNVI